jgi:hypothetical protein
MTETATDSHVPTASRTIAAFAKIHPAIIAAAAALGAYHAAPTLVEYFKPSKPLYAAYTERPAPEVFVPPTPTPITPTPPPPPQPALEEVARPVVPPAVRREEIPAPPVAVVIPPWMAAPAVPTGAIVRPPMRRQFIRVRPPRLSFAQGLSGVRGMIHLGHVMQMLHFIHRFRR